MTKVGKIKVGSFVRIRGEKEVLKVNELGTYVASLIDAEGNHYGNYPYDELKVIKPKKIIIKKIYAIKGE